MNSKLKLQAKGHTQKFDEIVKMVDDMIAVLGKEAENDEKSKTFCAAEFDKAADEQAAAEDKLRATESSIDETADEMATLSDEIQSLGQEIKDLDKAVATATEQRKEEHAEYVNALTMNEAAIALIQKAKARLEKVYKPALVQAESFLQTSARSDMEDSEEMDSAQDPPKNEKSGGVLGLMDMLIHELESGSKDAEYEEKTAQKDYSELMSDSQQSRATTMKAVTGREAAKAELEVRQQENHGTKATVDDEIMGIKEAIHNLHGSCDFIVENFDLRKEARTNEIESLKNAKAILSGANFR